MTILINATDVEKEAQKELQQEGQDKAKDLLKSLYKDLSKAELVVAGIKEKIEYTKNNINALTVKDL